MGNTAGESVCRKVDAYDRGSQFSNLLTVLNVRKLVILIRSMSILILKSFEFDLADRPELETRVSGVYYYNQAY